ncbi:hypothetical protein A0256_14600 [Mucilaginibacter sp. PAMC 26640]|nr:hypothetical protein A0256_14600 [Mucilaginibacter sp. PAMC 26640]
MVGNLLRVTNSELQEYLKDSSLLEDRIYNDEIDDIKLTDIDTAWEGIVFLLTGQCMAEADHPLLAVLFSGRVINEDQDLGYGPAHYVTPEHVKNLHDQISNFTIADLKQRFDPLKMTGLGVYPEIWEEGEEAFNYLNEYFVTVQRVYHKASSNNEAIITFLS